jgi:TetR/AcrR family transcriptional regulator
MTSRPHSAATGVEIFLRLPLAAKNDYNASDSNGNLVDGRQAHMQDAQTPRPQTTTNRQPGLGLGEAEREQRRREILNAARVLFAQKGYEATTMAEIAEGSRLAVGTLYKFFKDKRDLYQTLVAETVQDFEHQLTAALRDPPDDELAQLQHFIELGAELFIKHLPIVRVYYSETGAAFLYATAGLEDEAFLSYRRIVVALAETFRRGIEKGVFVDIDPNVLAIGLEGVHNAFLTALVRDPESYTLAQIADYTKRMFFDAVVRR